MASYPEELKLHQHPWEDKEFHIYCVIHVLCDNSLYFIVLDPFSNQPFKDEAQTALFKDPVRIAQ